MRRRFRRDGYASFLGVTNHAHRPGGAHMSQVQPAAGELRQEQVPRHHDFLGSRRECPGGHSRWRPVLRS